MLPRGESPQGEQVRIRRSQKEPYTTLIGFGAQKALELGRLSLSP